MMSALPHRYFIIHKPYLMVSQFKSPDDVRLLGDFDFDFPEGTHAIGRLDNHSEGLLILTTNKKVTKLLFEGPVPHKRTYLVYVNNVMRPETLEHLKNGVEIKIQDGQSYLAKPFDVAIVKKPKHLVNIHEHYREDIPQTWLTMTLTEGKFHQVRKMVKAIGHPCRRLIRLSIEDLQLGDLPSGAVLELDEADFFKKLNIDYKP